MTTKDGRRPMADGRSLRPESEKGQGRDTTMCGDPKTWSPVKVTYQREMKVKASVAIAYVPVGILKEIG